MESLIITIPDPGIKAYVDQVVSTGAYSSPTEFLVALVEEGRQKRKQARLEALLLEGLQGESTPLTAHDWEEIRQRFDEKVPESCGP